MNRQTAFRLLEKEAAACSLCERMCERRAVLSSLNGSLNASVMFIAEAPGRNGADRTRIPFQGDASGQNFEQLLSSINLKREEIFITNSVLCSPRKPSGANDKPTRAELRNCSDFLRRQIECINPRVVVTLGAVALEALKRIAPHSLTLRESAGKIHEWHQRRLVPLYHPSPQVIISVRSLNQQQKDFKVLQSILNSEK